MFFCPLAPHQQLFSQEAANMKNRDDRQILERLAQQANQFSSNGRSPPSAMHDRPLRNLESALYGAVNEQYNRHGKRVGVLESEVCTNRTSDWHFLSDLSITHKTSALFDVWRIA